MLPGIWLKVLKHSMYLIISFFKSYKINVHLKCFCEDGYVLFNWSFSMNKIFNFLLSFFCILHDCFKAVLGEHFFILLFEATTSLIQNSIKFLLEYFFNFILFLKFSFFIEFHLDFIDCLTNYLLISIFNGLNEFFTFKNISYNLFD